MVCISCEDQTPIQSPCVSCGDVECPTPNPCEQVISSECVMHMGVAKSCITDVVYAAGDSLGVIHSKIVDYFCGITRATATVTASRPVSGTPVFNINDTPNQVSVKIVTWVTSVFDALDLTPTGAGIIPILHSELVVLRDTGILLPGQLYLITDFATMYDQPDYDTLGAEITIGNFRTAAIVPIIVKALDINEISINAWQPSFPKDKIEYILDYATPATGTATKGLIIKRIDDRNNTCFYDHRTVLFKRYNNASAIPNSYFDLGFGSSEYLTFQEVLLSQNNVIGNVLSISSNKLYLFDLPNVVFFKDCDSNEFRGAIENFTVLNSILRVTVNGWCKNVLIYPSIKDCTFNTINAFTLLGAGEINNVNVSGSMSNSIITLTTGGEWSHCEYIEFFGNTMTVKVMTRNSIDSFSGNIFSGSNIFKNNKGSEWSGNVFNSVFEFNNIHFFQGNTNTGFTAALFSNNFGLTVTNNTFKNKVTENNFGKTFNLNSIGNDFGYDVVNSQAAGNNLNHTVQSIIGDGFINNLFLNSFNLCTVGNGFKSNEVKASIDAVVNASIDFTAGPSTHVSGDYTCEIYKNSAGEIKLSYIDALDVRQTVLPTV